MFNGLASVLGYTRPDMVCIAKIQIHPIKSCHGTSVPSACCTPSGLQYDREFMIVDAETHKMITARDFSKTVLIHPEVVPDSTSPDNGILRVSFPPESGIESFSVPLQPGEETCATWERNEVSLVSLLDDIKIWRETTDGYVCEAIHSTGHIPSARLSSFLSRSVHLVYKGPTPRQVFPTKTAPDLENLHSFQDSYPLLILSMESIGNVMDRIRQAVHKEAGWDVGGLDLEKWNDDEEKWMMAERFRPNIIVEGARAPFEEDSWEELDIEDDDNSVRGSILLVSRCARCLLPNVDPVSGMADKAIPYKVISKYRRVEPDSRYSPCVGVHGCPLTSGDFFIHVGDPVKVVRKLHRETLPMTSK